MHTDWFKDWFSSKDYLDVYQHRDEKDANEIIALILSQINLPLNSAVLDAACGAGRHAMKLAELGYEVTAFDLSKTLLSIAKIEANKKNLKINFVSSDLREFSSNVKFDLVLSLFTSFGYFKSDEENFLFVNNAYKMLNQNGFYVLDFLNKYFVEQNLITISEKEVGDKIIIENRNIQNGRVVKEIKIVNQNEEHNYIESVKLYSYNELKENFSQIGFKVKNIFGDYTGNEFNPEKSERCIIIFQK